ncbi:B-box zinc finger protein 32-like [Diospyros lotus]|uniref:B-box zinc finger protein 32-like n=1 Tax=Diospyros lotus TaxID=55363 RepID=UPI0022573832|nr:B-box zinc finger protein 32-like [Diospyros lotus]
MKKCELCNSVARMHCDADQAILCWDCDSKVHAANFLVAKHSRTLLCHACQSPTPWTGSGPKLAPTVSVCQACVRSTNATSNDDDDDESDDNNDDDENESGSDDDTSYDDEDDDGDNQVVPMTFTPLPPPGFSSSSSSEESSGRLHSDQEDKSKSTIGFLSKPPPWD